MNGILISAQVESIRSRKDKTVSLTLGTQELTPEKAGELFSVNGRFITAYLSAKDITQDEKEIIDSIEPDLAEGKSPSQRLRAVLFLMWKQDKEGYEDKNMHYQHHMERIIDHFKNKLDK